MRSRQGAQCRCNGWACERILCLIMCGEPSRASGEGCRPRKLLRCQADKSSWTMVPCPLWVISRHSRRKKSCPLCPRKRTCAVQLGMSAMGQKRTSPNRPDGSVATRGTASLRDRIILLASMPHRIRSTALVGFQR